MAASKVVDMRLPICRKRVAAAFALNCTAFASTATACAICVIGSDSFIVSHPHALRIAAATREAIERGDVKEGSIEPAEEFHATLARVAGLLSYAPRDSEPVIIDFVVVDESHSFRVEIQGGRTKVALLSDKDPPAPHGRIITTVPALLGLGNRELQLSQAIRDGLIEIETGSLARVSKGSEPALIGALQAEDSASE